MISDVWHYVHVVNCFTQSLEMILEQWCTLCTEECPLGKSSYFLRFIKRLCPQALGGKQVHLGT